MMHSAIIDAEIRHAHMFCGLGGGAKGFNKGKARVGALRARFRCIGGIDVDRAAAKDFERLGGAPGTVMDLFNRDQYRAFHGHEPPADWREATPADIQRAFGWERPHILFLSAPCKGFSGLLSERLSRSAKYMALNELTLRGIWLALEAYADDPVEFILFENVPRIASRGRHLLDQIAQLVGCYGYAAAETTHDCGKIGKLAQSRKRFLMAARHTAKVPPFLYQPKQHALRAVGDVLGRMSLPGDPAAGPMHRVPSLQWRTWVRLAFVEAGSDWRSLNRLRVEDGMLADYGIVPAREWNDGTLGVLPWGDHAGTVTGNPIPTAGRFSVADPRAFNSREGSGFLGVNPWTRNMGAVTANGRPGAGAFSVADPRFNGSADYMQYGVRRWDETSGAVSGQSTVGGGKYAVADPRPGYPISTHTNIFRVVRWEGKSGVVTGAGHVAGGAQSVADPRPAYGHSSKYRVSRFEENTGTVIAASTTGQGAFAVADPRPEYLRSGRDKYLTAGMYGVLPWDATSGAVNANGQHDNGMWSVADPRLVDGGAPALPRPEQQLVAVIQAEDGTWHRPFTTLELAALQSLVDPEEHLELEGLSDADWRERIGNAVPPDAAAEIAGVMGRTLLNAWSGQTSFVSDEPVWVRPVALGLAVSRMPLML